MAQRRYEYDGMIHEVPDSGGAYVLVPWNIREEFGKGRVKVHAEFDGIPYDGSIVNMGVKDEDGNVKYSYFLGMKNIMLHTTDENGKNTTNRDADGVMEYKMDVGFSANELERYCKIDWENVDRGPVTETNEITRKMQDNWLEDLANALPEDQKMHLSDVNISFNFNSDKFDD